VTPSPVDALLRHRPPPHQHDGPKVSVVPWFISTASHSDFSHGITDDFTSRLIRPATQPRRAGPYEISRGNAENFPTAPPAHTLLCPGAPSTSFASVVQARHHLDRADRFANFGYGSVFRLKPFGPHLTMGALSCAADQADTAAHNRYHRVNPPNNARRGITPAFGYGPRLGPVRLDFHQLALCAARRTLRGLRPTPRPPVGNGPAPTRPERGQGVGNHEMVPMFTKQSIGQGGVQLYPGSIAMATPQAFTMASSPPELNGFGVDRPNLQAITRCAPAHIRQIGAGFAVTELQPLVHFRYTFWPRQADPHHLAVLACPAVVRAACHLPRRSPDQAALRLHQAAATTQREGSFTPPRSTQRLHGAQLPREET
jgi:hypothetical protein